MVWKHIDKPRRDCWLSFCAQLLLWAGFRHGRLGGCELGHRLQEGQVAKADRKQQL